MPDRNYQKGGTGNAAINPGSKVALTTSSGVVFAGDNDATEIIVSNPHATTVVWLELRGGAAVIGEGMMVGPGKTERITSYNGEIRGICSTGTMDLGLVVI